VLIGMPVVVVLVLLTIFHGLNDGFVFAIIGKFAFVVPAVVVLATTAIAVDSSLASLLFVFCLPVEIADMVGIGFISCSLEILLLMVLVVSVVAVCLLFLVAFLA